MRTEHKELLLKDLCARLPYGVKVKTNNINILKLGSHTRVGEYVTDVIEPCKPYLFPLSSMTEEQKFECFKGTPLEIDKYGDIAVKDDYYGGSKYTDLEMYLDVIDWLNENHFDYRGLIEKGLAIDATNLDIY